jgi:Putative beta-barrel porin-2, OmpL-like. bbp2
MMLPFLLGLNLALGQVAAGPPGGGIAPGSIMDGAFSGAGQITTLTAQLPDPGQPAGQVPPPALKASPPDRRGFPAAPFESPPFPGSDFQGIPLIGVREDTGMQFLMKQAQGTPAGDLLLANRIKVYGWLDMAANLSSSKQSNFPVAYDIFPNTGYLDQAVLRFERVMDTAQTDHIDWGFKLDNLYGIDYRYTTAKGVFSEQLLQHNRNYGYDPVQYYGVMYFPGVLEGLVMKIGRYVSPPDIEAELALENYMHTHSITYASDPYTQFGVQANLRLDKQWMIQAAIVSQNDYAPWMVHAKPTGFVGVRWVSKDNMDSVYACMNSFNDGVYTDNHDNLQDAVVTWSHKFNDRVTTLTEAYYMWQRNAEKGGTENDGRAQLWGGPSGGGPGTTLPGISNELALLNFTEIMLGKWDYLTIRNEAFEDFQGQRTGIQSLFTTHAIGWTHYLNQHPDIQFRPEFDFDHSYNARGFDDGRRKNQFLLVADVLIRF